MSVERSKDDCSICVILRFIKSDFVFAINAIISAQDVFIHASIDAQGRLDIRVEGPMVQAMMFEIFVLAIVNELYFSRCAAPSMEGPDYNLSNACTNRARIWGQTSMVEEI